MRQTIVPAHLADPLLRAAARDKNERSRNHIEGRQEGREPIVAPTGALGNPGARNLFKLLLPESTPPRPVVCSVTGFPERSKWFGAFTLWSGS